FEIRLSDLPSPAARLLANPQMSGGHGGHDLNYRTLQAQGVRLLGRFIGVADGRAYFGRDLAQSVAFGDARYADVCELIRKACATRSVRAPEMPPPPPFVADAPERIALSDFRTIIFTLCFRDYIECLVLCTDALVVDGYTTW